MIGWQESLTAIVEVLVDVLVLSGTRISAVLRAAHGSWINADWLIVSTFVIHILKLF